MYSKEKDEVIKKDKIKKSEILLKLFGVTGLAIIFLALYDFFIAKDKEILTEDFLLVLSLAPLMTSHLILFIIIIPKFVKRRKKKLKINFVNSTTDFENVFEQLKQKYSEMLIKERNKTIFKSWGIFLWTISLIAFYIFFYMELAKFSEMNSSNWIYILCVYIIGPLSLNIIFAIAIPIVKGINNKIPKIEPITSIILFKIAYDFLSTKTSLYFFVDTFEISCAIFSFATLIATLVSPLNYFGSVFIY